MSRKMSLFEFWRRKKERGALLKRANELRLLPSQLKRLHGDSGVRAALQNTRMASLLPPVGTDVFRRLTPASLDEIQQRHETEEKERATRKENKEEVEKDQPKPASDLEAGKPLPFIYGAPPPELLSTPLEELDPYYQSQKTFNVLSKGNIIHRFNAESACYLLSPFNPLRTAAIKVLIHSLFRWFIMVTILINCVFMTMSNPPAWSNTIKYVFTAIYTFEAIVKVVSRGFCAGKFTFLRDPWNWLDIIVIITAYVTVFVDLGKFSVLSTVPRVLKILPLISGMKTTIGAVGQSVKRLAGVIVLMLFCLIVLALIAMQLFMGNLRQKCVIWPVNLTASYPDYDMEIERFDFSKYMNNQSNHYFLPGQLDALLCGNTSDSGVCPEGFTCIRGGKNPNYGFTNYDSLGWSLLSIIRLITLDFWENLMTLTFRAAGKSSVIFFVLLIFPGSFCLCSLFLAVVAMASGEQEEANVAKANQKVEEFSQIVEALKRREEEELAASRAELSEKQNGEKKKSLEQNQTAIEEFGDQTSCSPCWFVFADLFLKWNCCSCWRWLKQRLYAFITNPYFDFGIIICLVLNTLVLAMEHYPMTIEFEMYLSIARLVFTFIFIAEMVIKVVAMDPYGYFQVGWNIFDSIIVFFSLLEMSVVDVEGMSVLYSNQLMRIIRLARWWPSFHLLLKVIWTSLRALRNLTLLLVIMVFIFSVAGMQLFQMDYKDCVCRIAQDCELPRWHMNDFFHAFLIIVRALGGQWIETMWDCMEVAGQTSCLIFFMMFMVIGNLLVLNLFLTLLLSSFSGDSLVAPREEKKDNCKIAISQIKGALPWNKSAKSDQTAKSNKDTRKEYLALNVVASDQSVSEVEDVSGSKDHDIESQSAPIATAEIDIESKTPEEKTFDDVQEHPEVQKDKGDGDHKENTPEDCCSDKCYRCCPFLDIDTSQGRGRVWSNFRKACLLIVQNGYFDMFIIAIILLSTVALMFEDIHLQHRPVLKVAVETVDQVVTYLFVLEMLLKWVALGLKKYFTDAWCWLDFLILDVFLVSLTANMLGFSEIGAIQFLRTLRALGPLRALSRSQGIRLVVQVLVRTFPFIFDGLLVSLTAWLIFSILGVNLFAGKFYYCFNETAEEIFLPEDVNNKSECLSLIVENFTEVRWKHLKMNYDSVSSGYLSLLSLGLSAGWMDIMYGAVDAREVESQPVYESNMYMYLYFIFFFISCFFTLNFFIRVIINNLQKDEFGGRHLFMTERQLACSKAMKESCKRPQKPVPRPQNQCQAWLFDLLTKPYFEVFMVVVICLNMVIMMVESDRQSMEAEEILYWLHFVFIIIFLIECILKIIAFRKHYFTNKWNILDFVVLISTIIGIFFADLIEKYFISTSCFPMLRLARICRILHLTRFTRGIQKLLFAFVMSLPALLNFGLLLLIITVTFSIFGMFNFAYMRKQFLIDDMTNFETFVNSLICLFMITKSAAWDGLLLAIMNTPPDCDPYSENPGFMASGDCGSPMKGIIFFTTYIVLSFLLMVHLYIAVILEIFNSEDTEVLCDEDIQRFYNTWRNFDPDSSQFIPYSKLSDFCDTLQDPLRLPKPNTINLIHMDLPLFPGDKVHCDDVLLKLAAQVVDSGEMDSLKARMEEKFKANSSKVSDEPISSTLRRKQEEAAAMVIQRAYRKGLLQHRHAETAAESVNGGV